MPVKKVAEFSVSYLQILDEDGQVDPELVPDLSDEDLHAMYRWMSLAREVDQRMLKLQRQGRIGTFGPCTGQEACCVPPAYAMGERDWFVGAFRELGGRLVRGEPVVNTLLFHNGYEEGNIQPRGHEQRLLPINIIVASQNTHAAGIGYALKYRKEKAAAVVFMGDGATSQGDFYEGINFAGVWDAPVVFISQNNQWAISIPRSAQTKAETLAQKAIAAGIPCLQVDGNDALAVYKAASEALARAYAGKGPTFIEAITYRLMMHTTADDPHKYRTEEEEKKWWKVEPLIRFRKYLENKGIWDDKRQAALDEEIRDEVEKAVREMESFKDARPDAPFDNVFSEPHPEIELQRAEFLGALAAEKEADDA